MRNFIWEGIISGQAYGISSLSPLLAIRAQQNSRQIDPNRFDISPLSQLDTPGFTHHHLQSAFIIVFRCHPRAHQISYAPQNRPLHSCLYLTRISLERRFQQIGLVWSVYHLHGSCQTCSYCFWIGSGGWFVFFGEWKGWIGLA